MRLGPTVYFITSIVLTENGNNGSLALRTEGLLRDQFIYILYIYIKLHVYICVYIRLFQDLLDPNSLATKSYDI